MTGSSRFDRLGLLVGEQGLDNLGKAAIAVFGLGGVGSFAAEALVRGGIGRITLVDHDLVDITNINRQIQALDDTVGQSKAEMMARRCKSINPAVSIEAIQLRYAAETAERLLHPSFDYVLDCIDQVTAKLHLIESCLERKLPIISSMGAANKLDPSGIRVADLSETSKCGLARIMRKELRKRGIVQGVKVVYSMEPPCTPEPWATMAEAEELPTGRRAPLGSSSVVPPLFGLTMAGTVLNALIEKGQ
jgi:tRNA A37 threonylcarbamoyladenosine dehydratase